MWIFCNTQTTVERQYFSAIKKRTTSNYGQTWVTKIVNYHVMLAILICSQAAICLSRKNLRVNVMSYTGFLGRLWSGRNIAHYLCNRRAACHKEQYREFALINQRRSNNLGFRTLREKN